MVIPMQQPVFRRYLGVIVALCATFASTPILYAQVVGGQVVDRDSQRGLPAALVRLVDETGAVRGVAVTDRYGGYLVTVPTPGTYTVYAHAWGYLPDQVDNVPVVTDTVVSVMLVPATGAETRGEFVTGVVLDDRTKQPVASASVLLIDEDDKVRNASTTDENGLYGLAAPAAGWYTLRVDAVRYATAMTAAFELPRDETFGVAVRVASLLSTDPQTVRGTVVDDSTAEPISGAEVTVLDSLGRSLGSEMTDARGSVVFSLSPGWYLFRVRRIGYRPITEAQFIVHTASDTTTVTLALRPAATVLDPATVTGERLPYAPGPLMEFYVRRNRGMGLYLTREEIEEKVPLRTTDVFYNLPGVRVVGQGGIGAIVRMTRQVRASGDCPPILYVDRVRVGDADGFLNELFPSELEAIEIYRGASEIPPEFQGFNLACGVVVIWTRRGP